MFSLSSFFTPSLVWPFSLFLWPTCHGFLLYFFSWLPSSHPMPSSTPSVPYPPCVVHIGSVCFSFTTLRSESCGYLATGCSFLFSFPHHPWCGFLYFLWPSPYSPNLGKWSLPTPTFLSFLLHTISVLIFHTLYSGVLLTVGY